MTRKSGYGKSLGALAFWLLGLCFFAFVWRWSFDIAREDAENRIIGEAGRLASQLASLIAAPEGENDFGVVKGIVARAMEDESVYAVKVENNEGEIIGLRRNYLWEPVPWDDEITENCALGVNILKHRGESIGKVEVWLSARQTREDLAILSQREVWRLLYSCFLWTCAFLFLFWLIGDFRRLKNFLRRLHNPAADEDRADSAPATGGRDEQGNELVSPARGRRYQRDADAWRVTAGMFRQTFGRAPRLINRLYAEGEKAGLCHLGRILQQAAPCVGARKLEEAAFAMQQALNNPENETAATSVENCARILEETLDALEGDRESQGKLNRDEPPAQG